ncbi:sulfatase [candidate division CSSED10-310 bacterium]|uniref:Sulfatase n=1 Tax=candidate division CSSED10-310 bacterium TaxID=2855610 RepID=A0ABV6Z270_UNCC1
MKKHCLLLSAILFIIVLEQSCRDGSRQNSREYNVVFIVADALRCDVLGCYGGDVATPNIDKLAASGTLFENFYSTGPVTLSSSVAMFTGNYSSFYKVMNTRKKKVKKFKYSFYVNDDEFLLAEALKKKGFAVFMDLENNIAACSNNLQGFEKLKNFKEMTNEEIARVEQEIGFVDGGETDIKLITNYHNMFSFLHYLMTVEENQPFILLKWFLDPHSPYNPAEKFKRKISVDPTRLPENKDFYSKPASKSIELASRKRKILDYEHYYLKELYKAEVESIDERIGFIVQVLKKRKLLDKTFFIFTTDHGELFGEHGQRQHRGFYYQPLIHIPFMISGPGIPKGKRVQTRVSHLSLMPTLKELLQVKHTNNMEGTSFKGLLTARKSNPLLYFDGTPNNRRANISSNALIMDNYKLMKKIENQTISLTLHNLETDPDENINIAQNQPKILKKMVDNLAVFNERIAEKQQLNLSKINKDVNLSKKWQTTKKELKALGYLD